MKLIGSAAAILALIGVLTAWMEPPAAGLLHAAVLALAVACAGIAVFQEADFPTHWLTLIPLGCAAWGALQATMHWTVYPFETWNAVTAWLARAAIFSAAYAGFQHSRDRARLKSAIVWFGGAFSLLALLQWYAGGGTIYWMFETRYNGEVAGTFGNRDQYAAFIALLLPVALAESLAQRRTQLVTVACAGVMFASVIASASRAGAVIVCVEALVFLTAGCLGRSRNRRAAGMVAVSLLVCTLVGGWTYVIERFSVSDPFAFRREMLIATVDMIKARPVVGFGLGTWPTVYPAFAVFDPPGVYMNHAHNDWAEWAAEGGLPFLGMLAVFAGAAVSRLRRNLWALGIPAVLAHSLLDFPLQKPALACVVFFLAGVAAASARPRAAAEYGNFESQRP
jgi:O-antigen ligase